MQASIANAMPVQYAATQRFTRDGSEALENRVAEICARVAAAVARLIPPSQLRGLLLAGSYGRGEGGVLREAGEDQPYNDLEFYVFVRGNWLFAERLYGAALREIGHCLTQVAGLEIEFKLLTVEKLSQSPASMFYYDLVSAHRWIIGDDSLLAACGHHRDARAIPAHEATRLLMNRCSGLLFSAERLRRSDFGPEEADFVGRNLAKAQLALGDVVLAACGHYHWSCQERHQLLEELEYVDGKLPLASLRRHHAEGVAFKLHPHRSPARREELLIRHGELSALGRCLWLWLESRLLHFPFTSLRSYAFSALDKCPETHPLRNRLINARTFGPASAWSRHGVSYPRQRLFHALCLLLWEPEAAANPALLRFIQFELATGATTFAGLCAAYENLWHRFN